MSYQTKASGWESTPGRRAAVRRAHEGSRAKGAGRLEDFTELRGQRHTVEQAADRLGIGFRQAQRYEAARKKQASGQVAADV